MAIAEALDHAHRNGVVHRDRKPGNIRLTRDSVKLLDFGLAKLREREEQIPLEVTQSARLTEVGVIVGTVPYMAPEQIEGGDVDARTDIFSFGVVLHEMVCGRRPFAGDSRISLLSAIVSAEPPPLASLQPQTPASLERLILRCLAKDPEDRWQTARDLAAELRWIASEGSGTSTVVSGTIRRPRRAALWGAVAGAAASAAVLAAAVAVIWPTPSVAQYLQTTFRRGAVSAARFTPDGQNVVYSASWEGQPYGAFLGRPFNPDARDLQLKDARIMSISRAGDMAVVFGPQNISSAFEPRMLARIPLAGGARDDLLTGVVEADWIPGTDTLAIVRDPGSNRPWTVEFPAGTIVHEAPAAWSLRVSPDGHGRTVVFENFRFTWVGGSVTLDDGAHVLGRDPDVEIYLDSPGVSRRHALITIAEGRATIADLGSKSGTFGQLLSVPVTSRPTFAAGEARPLVESRYSAGSSLDGRSYDVSLDGSRFLMLKEGGGRIVVVQNWFEELKRIVPVGRRTAARNSMPRLADRTDPAHPARGHRARTVRGIMAHIPARRSVRPASMCDSGVSVRLRLSQARCGLARRVGRALATYGGRGPSTASRTSCRTTAGSAARASAPSSVAREGVWPLVREPRRTIPPR
jgi:hypothetical protein